MQENTPSIETFKIDCRRGDDLLSYFNLFTK